MTDPDRQPEYLSFDAASDRYEADTGFLTDALDTLGRTAVADLPVALRDALRAWYRTTDEYTEAVNGVIEEAEAG